MAIILTVFLYMGDGVGRGTNTGEFFPITAKNCYTNVLELWRICTDLFRHSLIQSACVLFELL